MSAANAKQKAQQLLKEAGISTLPVPVEDLARRLGARLSYEPFDEDISGMLARLEGGAVIGINTSHVATRQRFSVAHELGHLVLHQGRQLILDKREVRVNLRDRNAASGTDMQEIEANAFAAELLMPHQVVLDMVTKAVSRSTRISADQFIREAASRFEVSVQAMEYRLASLGVISANH
jgi:Zn-dependent peptidase ImmA (M78 family)